MDDFSLTFFKIVLIICGIVGFFSILNGIYPKQTLSKKALEEKQKHLKRELLKVSIAQIYALNKMIMSGKITDDYYDIQRDAVIDQLIDADIDILPIISIPRAKRGDINALYEKSMTLSSQMHDINEMTDDEFEKHIDQILDEKKRLG